MKSYSVEDRTSAIKNIQRMLGVNQSGIYDMKTARAVSDVQRAYGIEEDGTVDRITFAAILGLNKEREIKRAYGGVLGELPYGVGDYGDGVREAIGVLRYALLPYTSDAHVLQGAIYTVGVGAAVEKIREIYGLPISSAVDETLYLRMWREVLTDGHRIV